jgi:hypothetical protein
LGPLGRQKSVFTIAHPIPAGLTSDLARQVVIKNAAFSSDHRLARGMWSLLVVPTYSERCYSAGLFCWVAKTMEVVMKSIVFFLAVIFISGCIGVSRTVLTDGGDKISVVTAINASDKCNHIDEINTSQSTVGFINWQNVKANMKTELRNEAARQGATHIIFGQLDKDDGGVSEMSAEIYKCE